MTSAPTLDAWRRRVLDEGRHGVRWVRRNSFSPAWLPARWRGRRTGYVVGTALQLLAFFLTLLITMSVPTFGFRGSIPFLALVIVALTFGAGPSLWSTLVGALLSIVLGGGVLALGPGTSIGAKAMAFVVSLGAGALICIFASQAERARRGALESLTLARTAQAASERTAAALALERSRTNAMLASMPDQLLIYDAAGNIVDENRATVLATLRGAETKTIEAVASAFELRALDGRRLAPDELPGARVLRGEPSVSNCEVLAHLPTGEEQTWLLSAAPILAEDGGLLGAVTVARDITALRSAEQAAVLEDASLEATFEAMTDGVLLYDHTMRIVRSNRAVNDMFGYHLLPHFMDLPVDERAKRVVVRDRQGHVLPSDRLPQVRALHGETLTGANAVDLRIHTLYDTEIAASAQAAPLRDTSGAIVGAVCVFRDVTERVRAEDRLHRALETLMEMVAAIAEGSVETDSQRAERLIAHRVAELTCGVLGCSRVSISALDKDGDVMRPVAIVGLSPKETEEWWHGAEERPPRLSGLLGAAELRRFRAGEAAALDVPARVPELEQQNRWNVSTMMLAPLASGARPVGVLALDYGGERHTFSAEEVRLAVAIGRLGAFSIERERLRRARAREEARMRALAEANKLMDEFLGIASHELRTPLTSAKTNVQLAQRQVRRMRDIRTPQRATAADEAAGGINSFERLEGLLARANQQMDRQTRLVEDLLDVSRIQAGKLELRTIRADLATIVGEAVDEQRLAAPERTISLSVPTTALMVDADPDRIAQVVTNYLTNALKYAPEETPITVTLQSEGEQARFSVRDEGPGLPPAEQERVWQRFYRVKGIESAFGARIGLGLGLFICSTIIEQHGGRVGLESAPGAGSTFWFTLPLAA